MDNKRFYGGWDSAINTLGAGAVSGGATGDAASITNYTCTFNSTSQASVSFDVEWNAGAQAQIDSNYFSIYFTTQNHLLGYSDSDKVTLQVFKGLGINNILLDPITVGTIPNSLLALIKTFQLV